MDPDVPLFQVQTLETVLSSATAEPRFRTLLLGAFAALALLLAIVGVYGVIAYAVSQRTHEIGLRMALGAGSADVVRMVLSQGMTPVLLGVALGLIGAFATTRVLSSMLYEVSVIDPVTYAVVPVILLATALVASYVPARRAVRIDPGTALRNE
jgi:putative ABC transport system permease protein